MNKYIRTTKLLRKLVVPTPLISLAFNGITKYAELCLHGTTGLLTIHFWSISPYNKLLKMKTTKKTGNNQNVSRKVPEESVETI